MANKHTLQELQQWQSLPLSIKVAMTKDRIRNWVHEYGEDGYNDMSAEEKAKFNQKRREYYRLKKEREALNGSC